MLPDTITIPYDTIQRRLSILTLLILLLLPCQFPAHLHLHYFPLLYASIFALYCCPCGYHQKGRQVASKRLEFIKERHGIYGSKALQLVFAKLTTLYTNLQGTAPIFIFLFLHAIIIWTILMRMAFLIYTHVCLFMYTI